MKQGPPGDKPWGTCGVCREYTNRARQPLSIDAYTPIVSAVNIAIPIIWYQTSFPYQKLVPELGNHYRPRNAAVAQPAHVKHCPYPTGQVDSSPLWAGRGTSRTSEQQDDRGSTRGEGEYGLYPALHKPGPAMTEPIMFHVKHTA